MLTPQNALEQAMAQAFTDPAARPEFYTVFVDSEIFIPEPKSQSAEDAELGPALMSVPRGNRQMFAVFSSPSRLQSFLSVDSPYTLMKTREFLTLVQGAEVVLNPGSDFGKEFTAWEIASLLDGSLWQSPDLLLGAKTVTAPDNSVLLSQPANYPRALTQALSRLLTERPEVERAYLGRVHNVSSGQPPYTLIGIKTDGNWEELMAEAGKVVAEVTVPEPPVDFVPISGASSLEAYLLSTKPFYQRQSGRRKLFGIF